MNTFHKLEIKEIRRLTSDAVEIIFSIPDDLKQEFAFDPGQYITIKHNIEGEEIRRSYSLCSFTGSMNIAIGVKRIDNGKMSTFLTRSLEVGDSLEVLPPLGNFILKGNNVVGICAGSGITPILSMIKSYPRTFTLIYGNKSQNTTMFLDEIKSFDIDTHFVFSQEDVEGCSTGRINNDLLNSILTTQKLQENNHYFICGPGEMIEDTAKFLLEKGVTSDRIHFEIFVGVTQDDNEIHDTDDDNISDVTVIIDGDEFQYQLSTQGDTILDSAMDQGADLPFSCKGAVCCTCKAKVMEGEVRMTQNFSLSDQEVEEGYILSCQAHPVSKKIIVDFDEI